MGPITAMITYVGGRYQLPVGPSMRLAKAAPHSMTTPAMRPTAVSASAAPVTTFAAARAHEGASTWEEVTRSR